MNDWGDGYVTDIGYTYGYYGELNPLAVEPAFLDAGLIAPKITTACELGFGQGLSMNIHAAASDVQWYGTDFNPSQAGFAAELAAASGAALKSFDQSFAEFCQRPDLPDFDYVGMHGVWSWISDDNRKILVDFLRRKLKVGGVLYVGYNTQPGWAAMAPMRDLLADHIAMHGGAGHGIASQVDAALEFADRLLATNPTYARANPAIADRIKDMKGQSRSYIAHEYFNSDWAPMPFSKIAQWLSPAKLSFACSANYLEHVDVINLTPDQQALLKDISDPVFRENVRNFMTNQRFRRDYWVKGARPRPALSSAEAWRAVRVVLIKPRADVVLKAKGMLGEAALQEAAYGAILDVLADHKPHTVRQLEAALKDGKIAFSVIKEAMLILIGSGVLALVQDDKIAAHAKARADRLNAHLCNLAYGSADVNALASAVTGGAIGVDRLQQLFLAARSLGKKLPAEWADFAMQILAAQGQRIVKDGKPLTTPEENQAEMAVRAREFGDKLLPILVRLGVAGQ